MLIETINKQLIELQKNVDALRLEIASRLLSDRILSVGYGRTTIGYTILFVKPLDRYSILTPSDVITLVNDRLRPEYSSTSVEVYHTATANGYITVKIYF